VKQVKQLLQAIQINKLLVVTIVTN
jgi:hypothetical protein